MEKMREMGLCGHDEAAARVLQARSGGEADFERRRLHQSTESAGTPWEEQPGGSGEWGATMP